MSTSTRTTPRAGHPGPPPLTGPTRVIGTVALSTAIFMNVLDATIANVSLPVIAGDLGVSPSQGTWVITSFAIANAITIPLTGWLTQRMGQVRLFLLATWLFVLASWLCGLATSMDQLIAFRVFQGAVAGPMIPLSQSLMLSSYPRARAGTAIAIWSMTTLTAPVVGPLLGGWISDRYDWSWIFLINIPVGILCSLVCWRIYRRRESVRSRPPLDVMGLALLIVWVSCLQVVLDKGQSLDWFDSPLIIALSIAALVAFIYFIIWELTERTPLVNLRLFNDRNFLMGTLAMAAAFALFFGNIIVLPMWLQSHMGYTATHAGLIMAPVGVFAIVLTPVVSRLLSHTDPRILITVAFIAFAVVCSLRAGFTPQIDRQHLLIPALVQGAAMASFFVPLSVIALSNMLPAQLPAASSLSNFCRLTAGSFGASLATSFWENRAAIHRTHLSDRMIAGNPAYEQATHTLIDAGFQHEQALQAISGLIDPQAFTLSALDLFQVSAWSFAALAVLLWCAKRPTVQPVAAAG